MRVQPRRALILAAGRGARLMPLTAEQPKPMVVVGKRPMLEHILRGLRAAGIDDAVIVHGYRGDVIENYFGDGARLGMRLRYRAQQTLAGTAAAMRLTMDLWDDEPFVLQWGDLVLDPVNYPALCARYTMPSSPPACVLGVNWVDDPYAGGAVYRDGTRVLHMTEKPQPGTAGTHWNIAGLMLFTAEIWSYLAAVPPPTDGEYYVTQTMEVMLKDGAHIEAFELIGERLHITSPDDVAIADADPRLAAWDAACEEKYA